MKYFVGWIIPEICSFYLVSSCGLVVFFLEYKFISHSSLFKIKWDERAVTLRRLAKFSDFGTIGGHLILHRADMLSPAQSLYLLGCLSSFELQSLLWSD